MAKKQQITEQQPEAVSELPTAVDLPETVEPQVEPACGTPLHRIVSAVGDSEEVRLMAGDVKDVLAIIDGKGFESLSVKVEQLSPGASVSLALGDVKKLISAVKKAMA